MGKKRKNNKPSSILDTIVKIVNILAGILSIITMARELLEG